MGDETALLDALDTALTELEAEHARTERLAAALETALHSLDTLHGLWACDGFSVYHDALSDGCDPTAAWECFRDEMWQLDESKAIGQARAVLDHEA